MKLLASRNILIASALIAVLFVGMVLLHPGTGSSESMPSADRISPPPVPTGSVESLDAVLAAHRKGSIEARRSRTTPFSATVDSVRPVGRGGWALSASLDDGRAMIYIADREKPSITPPLAPGQTRAFTCSDWQASTGRTWTLYGCGTVTH